MQNRTLLIAVSVLAALGAFAWWSDRQPAEVELEEHEVELLPDTDGDAVQRLTIATATAKESLELARRDDGWIVEGDRPRLAIPELCDAAARAAVSVLSIRRLGDVGTGEGLGLDEGLGVSAEVEGRNQPFAFVLGGEPPVGGGRYLKIAGETEVHLIEAGSVVALEQDPLSFRDRRLVPTDPDAVSVVTITPRAPGEIFSMRRDGRHWFLDGEPPYRVETSKARQLVHDLVELEAESFDASGPTADGIDVQVHLADDAGRSVEIAFGEASVAGARDAVAIGPLLDGLAADQPARVRPQFLAAFDADPLSWRSMELLDFNPWLVSEIDWSVAGQSWELRKGDDGWERIVDGAPLSLDGDRVHDFLSELDGLRATEYAPSTLDPASAGVEEARITLRQDEEVTVAITLFRGGNEDYVRVEGEPGLRTVGADVHEAIGNLRPLEPTEP